MTRLEVTNTSGGIGASVRLRRVEAGIRQDHLAARVGISASHLSRFERGERDVSMTTLEAIISALIDLGRGSVAGLTSVESSTVDGASPDPAYGPRPGPTPSADGSSRSPPTGRADGSRPAPE